MLMAAGKGARAKYWPITRREGAVLTQYYDVVGSAATSSEIFCILDPSNRCEVCCWQSITSYRGHDGRRSYTQSWCLARGPCGGRAYMAPKAVSEMSSVDRFRLLCRLCPWRRCPETRPMAAQQLTPDLCGCSLWHSSRACSSEPLNPSDGKLELKLSGLQPLASSLIPYFLL